MVKLDVHHLRTQLRNICLEECGSVDVYIDKFQNLCDQIAMDGPPISDREWFYEMINRLPSAWKVSEEIMATWVTSTKAWEELITYFLANETELREERNIPANSELYSKHWKKSKGRLSAKHGDKTGEEKFNAKCNGCGKSMHRKADCWQEEGNKGKRPKWWNEKDKNEARATKDLPVENSETKTQMWAIRDNGEQVMAAKPAPAKANWVLDSGCTRHVTPCRKAFTKFESIPDGQHAVETATCEQVYARVSGNVTVRVRTPEGKGDVEIFDALSVPLCTSSLV